jgi:hypothetical protein
MRNQCFLFLLLIVLVMLAVASMAQAGNLKASEEAAVKACKTIVEAETSYASANNGAYTDVESLMEKKFLPVSFLDKLWKDGYTHDRSEIDGSPSGFRVVLRPTSNNKSGRYLFSVATDGIVRFAGPVDPDKKTEHKKGDPVPVVIE